MKTRDLKLQMYVEALEKHLQKLNQLSFQDEKEQKENEIKKYAIEKRIQKAQEELAKDTCDRKR